MSLNYYYYHYSYYNDNNISINSNNNNNDDNDYDDDDDDDDPWNDYDGHSEMNVLFFVIKGFSFSLVIFVCLVEQSQQTEGFCY